MNDESRNSAPSVTPEILPPLISGPRPPKAPGIRRLVIVMAMCALAVGVFRTSSYRSRLSASLAGAQPNALLGREIYIAEGCIHCHTQYVRPGTRDEILWGPAADPARILAEQPPLIGNRRQGPDLMNIGNRRSPEWNRRHLMNPRALVPASRMPSYAHLFAQGDVRGEALVAYLGSLGADMAAQRKLQIQKWQPASDALKIAPSAMAALYRENCAQCHGERGTGDGPLADEFGGSMKCRISGIPPGELTRVIKFGIPGRLMPGHETLSDPEIIGLADYVETLTRRERKP